MFYKNKRTDKIRPAKPLSREKLDIVKNKNSTPSESDKKDPKQEKSDMQYEGGRI